MRALFPLKKKKKKSRLDCDTQIMVDTGTKELAKKLTFAAVGDVTTDDDDVVFFTNNNPVEKEDAEKKRAASIARAKEDPKAQSLRR